MKIAEKIQIIDRNILADNRGYFLKILTGKEEFLPAYTGEIYLTSAKPNEAKGGHYHPAANEWFILLQGECLLKLFDIATKESASILLSADEPKTIFVPNNIAHIFCNTNDKDDFLLLAYTDMHYNPNDTIVFQDFD
ncbi:MAG: hypothetical protein EOP45_08120 [Sphingobacteriaceae bacterium]|nr:MAG: hypothetical protein EOP45_08120 [Sphingobacteriaceae bacterium]